MLTDLNTHFNTLDQIKDTNVKAILLATGRVFTTRARFYGHQAAQIIGPEHDYAVDQRTYSGTIITQTPENWKEAKEWAAKRGFGETVDGILTDEIPFHDQLPKFNPN